MINNLTHSILGKGQQKSHHLFVVDDDQFVRTSFVRRLRRDGYHVDEFESGESVIECLTHTQDSPDVIIVDFKMPGLNGLETTKRIRQLFPFVPVILLTAYLGAINEDEAAHAGVFKILTKTIDLEFLLEMIHHAIEHQQQ